MESILLTRLESTIHNPNGLGQACDLRQADLIMPRTTSSGGFPNFPPFRVDEAVRCDSTITMVDGLQVYWRQDLELYPNPVMSSLQIRIPDAQGGWLKQTSSGKW